MSINLDAIFNSEHEPALVSGTVASCNADVAVIDLFDGGQGFLPITNWNGKSLPAIGKYVVAMTTESAATPVLTTIGDEFISLLVSGVCPEVANGQVRVMGVARLPGVRSKISVAPTVEGVDAVRAVVGRAASRVAALSEMLNGERVDVVVWSSDRKTLLANAMAPAAALGVKINKNNEAVVSVDPNKVAAAVGVHGTNATLAKMLAEVDKITVVGADS